MVGRATEKAFLAMPLQGFEPLRYGELLEQKSERVLALFEPFEPPAPRIIPSAEQAYHRLASNSVTDTLRISPCGISARRYMTLCS